MPGFKGLEELIKSGRLDKILEPMPTPMVQRIDFIHPDTGHMRWRIIDYHVALQVLRGEEFITLHVFLYDGHSIVTTPFGGKDFVYPHSPINEMPVSAVPSAPDMLEVTEFGDQTSMYIPTSQVLDGTSQYTLSSSYVGFSWAEQFGAQEPPLEIRTNHVLEEKAPELPRGKRPLRKLRIKDE